MSGPLRYVFLAVALAAVVLGTTSVPSGAHRAEVAAVGTPCDVDGSCEPIIGVAGGMAVPLLRPWLRGNDGGWDRFTTCCAEVNPKRLATVSGLINSKSVTVVPSGGAEFGGPVYGHGAASVVFAVSGRSYHYTRYAAQVTRINTLSGTTGWNVVSYARSYSCHQVGAARVPTRDCGRGTEQRTHGSLNVTTPSDPTAPYTVNVPITYISRPVNASGTPLGPATRTSTGHWRLSAQSAYHGWLWTVEWSVNSIAMARIAGSSYATSTRIYLTDGPFN